MRNTEKGKVWISQGSEIKINRDGKKKKYIYIYISMLYFLKRGWELRKCSFLLSFSALESHFSTMSPAFQFGSGHSKSL